MGNAAAPGLTVDEIDELREIAGTMIPADAALGMPGADDPVILADIVRSVGRDLAQVREAVAAIGRKSGGAFAGMSRDEREALMNGYHAEGGAPAATGRPGATPTSPSARTCVDATPTIRSTTTTRS